MINFLNLEYFLVAAEELSFTKAARKHFVSQTAISRQIQQLEQELKVSLLERNTAHVRLTAAGRFFYEKTSALCAELQQTVEQTRALDYETRTHLTLGIPSIVESHAVSLHLRAFHNACPQVAVRFSAGSRQGLVTALVQAAEQLGLFDPQAPRRRAREERLERAMDVIRGKYGPGAVTTASLAHPPKRADWESRLPF